MLFSSNSYTVSGVIFKVLKFFYFHLFERQGHSERERSRGRSRGGEEGEIAQFVYLLI